MVSDTRVALDSESIISLLSDGKIQFVRNQMDLLSLIYGGQLVSGPLANNNNNL